MIDPTRQRQLEELDAVSICVEILANSRNELYMNMRFLDLALSSLSFQADPGCAGVGTDGYDIFYRPEYLMGLYRRGRVYVNRAYLHMVDVYKRQLLVGSYTSSLCSPRTISRK